METLEARLARCSEQLWARVALRHRRLLAEIRTSMFHGDPQMFTSASGKR